MSTSSVQCAKNKGYYKEYVAPTVSAAVANVVSFYGFVAKSEIQSGSKKLPPIAFHNSIIRGLKSAPNIGCTNGAQLIFQSKIKHSFEYLGITNDFACTALSSLVIGFFSIPALVVFSGHTIGQSPLTSLKSLSLPQANSILARESIFVFSLQITDTLSKFVQNNVSANTFVDYSSTFFSGAIGAAINHPFDTLLVRLQKKIPLVEGATFSSKAQTLYRGVAVRSVTLGVFACTYRACKEYLEN